MTASRETPAPLRDPAFLLWLGRFAGVWTTPRRTVHVERRPDGLLRAFDAKTFRRASLARTLSVGSWQREPPSPLGFYPVVLSGGLIALWVSPEAAEKASRVCAVGAALRHYVRLVEQKIAEMSTEERDRRWVAYWQSAPELGLSAEDRRDHLAPHERWTAETA